MSSDASAFSPDSTIVAQTLKHI